MVGSLEVGGAMVGSELVGPLDVGSVDAYVGPAVVAPGCDVAVVAVGFSEVDALDAEALAELAASAASVGDAAPVVAAAELLPACDGDPVVRGAGADEAGTVGVDAHSDGPGKARALLTPASTPITPSAATLPMMPMRSVCDCAAYQSRTLSVAPRRPGVERATTGLGAGRASGSSEDFQLMKDGASSSSIARRARSAPTSDPPESCQ